MSDLIPSKSEILNGLLFALVKARNLSGMSHIIFEHLKPLIPMDRLGIVALSDDGRRFISIANVANFNLLLNTGYNVSAVSSTLMQIMQANQVRVINDMPEYLKKKPKSESTKLLVAEGIKSNMSVPLFVDGKSFGVLFLASKELGSYGKGHVDILNHLKEVLSYTAQNYYLISKSGAVTSGSIKLSSENSENGSQMWTQSWKNWEVYILSQTLKQCGGKIYGKNGAAAILKLPPTTLQGKLKKLGLNRKEILHGDL